MIWNGELKCHEALGEPRTNERGLRPVWRLALRLAGRSLKRGKSWRCPAKENAESFEWKNGTRLRRAEGEEWDFSQEVLEIIVNYGQAHNWTHNYQINRLYEMKTSTKEHVFEVWFVFICAIKVLLTKCRHLPRKLEVPLNNEHMTHDTCHMTHDTWHMYATALAAYTKPRCWVRSEAYWFLSPLHSRTDLS